MIKFMKKNFCCFCSKSYESIAAYKLQRDRTQERACRTSEILGHTVSRRWRCESSNLVIQYDEPGGDIVGIG